MLEVYEDELELLEELVDFFGNPGAFPVPAHAHVSGVVCGPLVVSGPAAPLDGEAFVDVLEVVADVSGVTVDFLRFFAAGVGEVAVGISLAVTLEDSREGAGFCAVVVAAAIVFAVNVHPGDGQVLHVVAFGEPDVVIGHSVGGGCTDAVLHVLHQGVAEHGSIAKAINEHAAGIDAVVFVQGRERLGEKVVVALTLVPQTSDSIQRDENVVAILVEHLLAVVRSRMVVVRSVVHEVLATAAVAVQRKEHLVRLLVVVVLGQGDKVFAGVVSDSNLELVAVFDALDFSQCGIGAAAFTRGRIVFQCVTEFECRCGRNRFRELHVECGVESAQRHRERIETFGDKADGFALLGVLHEGGCTLCAEGAAVAPVSRELERLLCATDGHLCEVGAARAEALAQVVCAGTLQGALEDLAAERVENLHLYGRVAALRIREDTVVDTDISDGVPEGRMDGVGGVFFVFVDGELALVIGRGVFTFLKEAYRGAFEGFTVVVRDGPCYGVC